MLLPGRYMMLAILGLHGRHLGLPSDPAHLSGSYSIPNPEEGGLPYRGSSRDRPREGRWRCLQRNTGQQIFHIFWVGMEHWHMFDGVSSSRALKEVLYPGNSGYYSQTGGNLANLRYNTTIEKVGLPSLCSLWAPGSGLPPEVLPAREPHPDHHWKDR